MAKVYVVQLAERKDHRSGLMVPVADLTPAEKYGELVYLLPTFLRGMVGEVLCKTLRYGLRNFTDDDYLLGIGDPMAIGAATAIACRLNMGRAKFLRWEKVRKDYMVFNITT